jgi:hypothetical protein
MTFERTAETLFEDKYLTSALHYVMVKFLSFQKTHL